MDPTPKRPIPDMRLCAECEADLEVQRTAVGERGCAVTFCPHNLIHGTWLMGQVHYEVCTSLEQAHAIDEGLSRFLAQTQAVSEQIRLQQSGGKVQ